MIRRPTGGPGRAKGPGRSPRWPLFRAPPTSLLARRSEPLRPRSGPGPKPNRPGSGERNQLGPVRHLLQGDRIACPGFELAVLRANPDAIAAAEPPVFLLVTQVARSGGAPQPARNAQFAADFIGSREGAGRTGLQAEIATAAGIPFPGRDAVGSMIFPFRAKGSIEVIPTRSMPESAA